MDLVTPENQTGCLLIPSPKQSAKLLKTSCKKLKYLGILQEQEDGSLNLLKSTTYMNTNKCSSNMLTDVKEVRRPMLEEKIKEEIRLNTQREVLSQEVSQSIMI